MRRALGALGVLAVVGTGCAAVSGADEEACDFLYANRAAARDDDSAARERLLDRLADAAFLDGLSADLRPYVERIARDAEREDRGRDVRYFSAHVDDALSVCMDVGW